MPFDFHNRDRIKNIIEELESLRYRDRKDLEGLLLWEDHGTIGNRIPQGTGQPVETGFCWKGWDRYNWLTADVEIPREWKDKEVVGLFDFGARTGTGNNGDFESLLYLNGMPYQAVDGNHHEVFLEPAVNGYSQELKFRLWSGLSGSGLEKRN